VQVDVKLFEATVQAGGVPLSLAYVNRPGEVIVGAVVPTKAWTLLMLHPALTVYTIVNVPLEIPTQTWPIVIAFAP